jgi:hypothetical protein
MSAGDEYRTTKIKLDQNGLFATQVLIFHQVTHPPLTGLLEHVSRTAS